MLLYFKLRNQLVIHKAELPKVDILFRTQFPSLGIFINKQARKGFRPPSAMKGIGYFQNLRNLMKIEIFWIFWGIF